MQSATLYLVKPAKATEPDPRIGMRVRIRMPEMPRLDSLTHFWLWVTRQICIDTFADALGIVEKVEKDAAGTTRYTICFGETNGKKTLRGGYLHTQLHFLGDEE